MADEEEAGAAFIAAEGFAGAKEGYKFEVRRRNTPSVQSTVPHLADTPMENFTD